MIQHRRKKNSEVLGGGGEREWHSSEEITEFPSWSGEVSEKIV
jgi:hypothetical protein